MGLGRLILVLIVLPFGLNAQTTNFQEEVYVSVNSTNISVGEKLYLSAFVYSNTSKKLSKLSSILYIELIDEDGMPVYQTKIGLRKGRGSGSIYIHPEWFSSTYRLVAYTRWMQNYHSYFEQEILVFNPYNNLIQGQKLVGNPLTRSSESHADIRRYDALQKVSLNLGKLDPSSISISINKVPNLYYLNDNTLDDPVKSIKSFKLLPEYKYGLVQGNVNNADRKLRINMSIKGSKMQIATTETDSAGNFYLNYNPSLSSNNAEIQIQVESDTIGRIVIVDEFYEKFPALDTAQVTLDSTILSEIINRSIGSQIQIAYQKQIDAFMDTRPIFTLSYAEVYHLDDYQRFPSVRDTFIELLNNVGVSKSEENYKINVRCNSEPPNLTLENPAPLILLDGLKVTAKELLNISPNSIEKIEVIPEYYFVNDVVYKGVISVHSFKGNLNVNIQNGLNFPIANYQPYNEEGYQLRLESRIPPYQTDLYWNPVYSHAGGELIVNFSTSTIEGTYQISVKGISKNGNPINITKQFQVTSSREP